jgi:putative aminopeptidase FrvX
MSYIDEELLIQITSKLSPSGYEKELSLFIKKYIDDNCTNVKAVFDSNELYAFRLSQKSKTKTILFDAHIDQVSCRVFNITNDGFLLCKSFGMNNIDILGSRCTVITRTGKIQGIISILPPHLDLQDNTIIVDIFTESKEESEKIVEIGDSVLFDSKIEIISSNSKNKYITGAGLDNHIGIYVLTKLFLEIDRLDQIDYNFIAHFSGREEVGGLRYINMLSDIDKIPKKIDIIIVIDTDVATDLPNIDKAAFADSKLGEGTILSRNMVDDNDIYRYISDIANDNNIKYQVTMSDGNGGNNLAYYGKINSIGQSIGIPLRYMHSAVELVRLDDINNTISLLYKFILNLDRFFITK